ncbi:MAG: flagellar basal body P-ring formation chaperone FlgA [Phycisphaerae bacterium]|nr:flagellar basal body P-ring formation chaperone FlgA [Phycisphaerae bacterium]
MACGLWLLCMTAVPVLAQSLPMVKIYVPRLVQVDGETLTLGQLCVIHCEDSALSEKASAVAMGRGALSREALVLDRQAIAARLAAEGIAASRVEFSGAEKLTITREERLASPAELLAAADAFLKENPPGGAAKWTVVKPPPALAGKCSAGQGTLSARLVRGVPVGQAKVEVTLIDEGKAVARAEILYRLQYNVRQAVATREIAAGDTITPENVEVRTVLADRPAAEALPYGRVAASAMAVGSVVSGGKLKAVKPALAVAKDQAVVMRITGPAFTVTAMGQALEDGQVGQCIRVRNIDSKRVLMATVRADGSVEPVMQRGEGVSPSRPSTDQPNGTHNAGGPATTKRSEDGTPASREETPALQDDDTAPIAVASATDEGGQR